MQRLGERASYKRRLLRLQTKRTNGLMTKSNGALPYLTLPGRVEVNKKSCCLWGLRLADCSLASREKQFSSAVKQQTLDGSFIRERLFGISGVRSFVQLDVGVLSLVVVVVVALCNSAEELFFYFRYHKTPRRWN